jgi:cobalt-zinc-cadmium resistance protein CzcA
MLNAIIDWSLRNRFLVLVATVCLLVVAWLSRHQINIDAFPDPTPVQVQINSVAPGLAPNEVERQITFPVEQAIGGLPSLSEIRSMSKFGLSQVVVTFEDGTDIYFARQLLNERLGSVELPAGMPRPMLGPVATGLGEVFHYLITSKRESLSELRTLQDWVLRPSLRTVPGTAEINSWGGLEKEYQVLVDPERLLKFNLSFAQVVQAVRDNNLNVGGGNLNRSGEMLLIRGVGRTSTLEQIRDISITAREGVPIHVGDVAEVRTGPALRMGAVTAQGKGEAVLGLGFLIMNQNGHEVTIGLKHKLDEIKKNLPADVKVEPVYQRTELVDQVIATVKNNLLEGGLLVVAVLFVFLGNLRAGLIVALAIPLSMMFAFGGMVRFGIAASLLSLGALDFGLVVDSSVIMVENIVRHLNDPGAEKLTRREIVRNAAIEVRQPTMFGELIIMIVYLPVLTLEGVEGKFYRPMALTVIFALLGSLVLSLTLMPVLASWLLPRRMHDKEPWIVRLSQWIYAPFLRLALGHKAAVLLAGLGLVLGSVAVALGLGADFVPRLSEGALTLTVLRLPGTSLEESLRYNSLMERLVLAEFPDEVNHVWSRCGTAEIATDPMGPEETDFFITLKPREQWKKAQTQDELTDLIKRELKALPGQNLLYSQPIEQRVNEMIAGVKADLAVKVFGDNFDVLREKAEQVEKILRSIEGSSDVNTEALKDQEMLQIRVRQDQIARYGVSARSLLELVESLGPGAPGIGEVLEEQRRFPMAVRLPDRLRSSPEAIGSILVGTPLGERVPLSRLADIDVVRGPSRVSREAGQRRIVVQANVRGRDLGTFVAEAQQKVAEQVKLPHGRYRLEWGGKFENYERGRNRLFLILPIALILIFTLLYLTYGRLIDVVLVIPGIPFAWVGGVLALWFRGLPLSISAGVGFIALSGVAVLNSMVLVSFIRQLRSQGLPLGKAVEDAAMTRLRPVLMTALVASLGFVPMALSTGVGAEVQRPLATVVIGGIISSTLLTLLVLPVLYALFGPRRVPVHSP